MASDGIDSRVRILTHRLLRMDRNLSARQPIEITVRVRTRE